MLTAKKARAMASRPQTRWERFKHWVGVKLAVLDLLLQIRGEARARGSHIYYHWSSPGVIEELKKLGFTIRAVGDRDVSIEW